MQSTVENGSHMAVNVSQATSSSSAGSGTPLKKVRINKVKDRILFLPPTVHMGLENEANLKDFEALDKMIGRGAFGSVFKAIHKISKRVFALKVIAKSKVKGHLVTAMVNEVKIMYALNHENIVRLFNHFEDDDNIYLILEFADEGQLMDKIKGGKKLQEVQAALCIRDLVQALEYLHGLNPPVIHRDIKPENLLVSGGRIKLGDFGWSNYSAQEQERNTYCGTPEYLAPEMITHSGHTEKLDIWCVGILLFELLSGRTPFLPRIAAQSREEMERALQQSILKGNINFPSDFPIIARDLCLKLLKPNPRDRLPISEIKKHHWFVQTNTVWAPSPHQSIASSLANSGPVPAQAAGQSQSGISKGTLASTKPPTQPAKPPVSPSAVTTQAATAALTAVTGAPPPVAVPKRSELVYEVEGRKMEDREVQDVCKGLTDLEASKFFKRESVLDVQIPQALKNVKLQQRKSIIDQYNIGYDAGSGRKSTGIKSNELISKMNEQIYQKDNRIQELTQRVEELEKDKARLQGDFERLKTTISFGSVNSAFNGGSETSFGDQYGYNSAPLPSLEAKRSKMIEEERDRLRKQVEDLVKSVGNKQEEVDALSSKLRRLEALEKDVDELRSERNTLLGQLRERENQIEAFNAMVTEAKESKNKEIDQLQVKINEYESKLFTQSKENNQLIIRDLVEYTNATFHDIQQNIATFQSQKSRATELAQRVTELETKLARIEQTHRSEILDLQAEHNSQLELRTEELEAKHRSELSQLREELYKVRFEFEETETQRNSRITLLEKSNVDLAAENVSLKKQDSMIKELEALLNRKGTMIATIQKELERHKQRLEDLGDKGIKNKDLDMLKASLAN